MTTQVKKDPLNRSRLRNIHNTDRNYYNCGGYALETFSWYRPWDDSCSSEYPAQFEDGEAHVDYMIRDFKGSLRKISEISDLKSDEYAIAYRLSYSDFHYIKRASNGRWYHKRGCLPKIESMSITSVFSEAWIPERVDGGYRGKIWLLAMKRVD